MIKLKLMIGALSSFLFLSGCSTFYQPIPKDTVMVKEIAQLEEEQKPESPGTLSEETVETLSINAINKYFHTNFSDEDLSLEMSLTELDQIKTMLYSFWGRSDVDPLVRFETELTNIDNGLYSVTATNRYDTHSQYRIMLNASDGDILEIENSPRYRNDYGKDASIDLADIVAMAKQQLEIMDGISPEQLDFRDPEPTIMKDMPVASVFLRNKTSGIMQVALTFDMERKELLGFSKGIMFALSYPYFRYID